MVAWTITPRSISRIRLTLAATEASIRGNVRWKKPSIIRHCAGTSRVKLPSQLSSPMFVATAVCCAWIGGLVQNSTFCRKPQAEVLGSKTGIQLYATTALWGNRMDLSIWPVEKGENIKERNGRWDRLFFWVVCLTREGHVRATCYGLLPFSAL